MNTFSSIFTKPNFSQCIHIAAIMTCLTIYMSNTHLFTHLLFGIYLCSIIISIWHKQYNLTYLALCIATCSGFAQYRVKSQYSNHAAYRHLLKHKATIKGTVIQVTNSTLHKNQTTILIQTSYIVINKKRVPLSKRIALFIPTTTKDIHTNQVIKIFNCKLNQPENKDYERYLIKENIWGIGHSKAEAILILKNQPLPRGQKIIQSLQNKLSNTTQQLFTPLFLGLKEKKIDMLKKQHLCSYWGISHHMARSGAHLVILLALLITLMHYLQLPHRYQYPLYALLLFGYSSISYSSISFLRAVWMSLLYAACKTFKLIPSSSHILMLTTLLIALNNPMQLFFLDFQLSFGITYIIIWFFSLKKQTTIALFQSNYVRS